MSRSGAHRVCPRRSFAGAACAAPGATDRPLFHRRARCSVTLLAAALVAACAGLGPAGPTGQRTAPVDDIPAAVAAARAADLPAQVELDGVAFHPQADYQCGPAALATAFSAAGIAAAPAALADQVFVPDRRGTLQPEMLAATRRAGLLPYVLPGELSALFAEVAAGHPVIVLQDLGSAWQRRWHYAVLVGYDLARGDVVLRSGGERRLTMTLADFAASWRPGGRWALLALAPDAQPANADPDRFLRAAADLERVRPGAAEVAYRSALRRWPDPPAAPLLQLGLGNAAYAQGRLRDAEAAFRAAVALQPQAADAWNNLAQVLHEQGRAHDAEAAARRAVDLGGPRLATYETTLAEVLAQLSGRLPDSVPEQVPDNARGDAPAPGTGALQRGNGRRGHGLD